MHGVWTRHGGSAVRGRNSGAAEAGPWGAALRNTTISSATEVRTLTAMKPSITAWVVAAART